MDSSVTFFYLGFSHRKVPPGNLIHILNIFAFTFKSGSYLNLKFDCQLLYAAGGQEIDGCHRNWVLKLPHKWFFYLIILGSFPKFFVFDFLLPDLTPYCQTWLPAIWCSGESCLPAVLCYREIWFSAAPCRWKILQKSSTDSPLHFAAERFDSPLQNVVVTLDSPLWAKLQLKDPHEYEPNLKQILDMKQGP